MPVEIDQFTCRSDNFGILIRDVETGVVALVDAPEETAILAAVERTFGDPPPAAQQGLIAAHAVVLGDTIDVAALCPHGGGDRLGVQSTPCDADSAEPA